MRVFGSLPPQRYKSDICLLVLSKPLVMSERVSAIDLRNTTTRELEECTIAGWGETHVRTLVFKRRNGSLIAQLIAP